MNKITFGFIGTFSYWHGVEVIQELVKELSQKYKQVHFLMIGDGVLLPPFKQMVKENNLEEFVTFTGLVAQDQGPDYLAQCDAYLCPTQPNADGSRFFGSPTKLFEYMSMARPVIASDIEQLGEVVSPALKISGKQVVLPLVVNDEVGIVVDPLDVQGFVKACEVVIHMEEEQRLKMGNNARTKVIKQYTWKQHVKKIIDFAKL